MRFMVGFFLLGMVFYLDAMESEEEKASSTSSSGSSSSSGCSSRRISDAINLAGDGPVAENAPIGMKDLPWVGRYGEKYDLAVPALVVRLPKKQLAAFPEPLVEKFADYEERQLDLFLIISSDESLGESTARNLLFHLSAFPMARFGETHSTTLSMGIFEPRGILPETEGSGIAFDQFSPQEVIIHPSGNETAFSPNNARFQVDPRESLVSFFGASELPEHRAVVFYQVIFHQESSVEGQIFEVALHEENLSAFLNFINKTELAAAVKTNLNRLLLIEPDSPDSSSAHESDSHPGE